MALLHPVYACCKSADTNYLSDGIDINVPKNNMLRRFTVFKVEQIYRQGPQKSVFYS